MRQEDLSQRRGVQRDALISPVDSADEVRALQLTDLFDLLTVEYRQVDLLAGGNIGTRVVRL